MKKTLQFAIMASIALLIAACGNTQTGPNGGGEEEEQDQYVYLLCRIKDATPATPQEFIDVRYFSLDPAVIGEVTIYHWSDESLFAPKRKDAYSKAPAIFSITTLQNIKIAGNAMTADMVTKDGYESVAELLGNYVITLNPQGYATNIKFTSKNTDSENNEMTVEYNADGYMTKVSYVSENEKDIYEFTYTDGNISKKTETYSYNNGTEDKEFKYETIISGYQTENKGGIITPVLMDTGVMFEVFCSLGVLGKPAPSLPSKAVWSEDEYETYSYEKYASGYLSAMTMNYTSVEEGKTFSDVTKYSFEYMEVPVI